MTETVSFNVAHDHLVIRREVGNGQWCTTRGADQKGGEGACEKCA
ncbi:MAG: hypothetical protein V3T18_09350 [Pseudomonadales bacterium]